MGYTHYHPQNRDYTTEEWASLTEAARAIIATSAVPLAREYDEPGTPPEIDGDRIMLNGIGDDGHETFILRRIRSGEFEFTKTAAKPYDEVVTAILATSHTLAPDALRISSDGNAADWDDGVALARRAMGKAIVNPKEAVSA
jgi:hypothetical protein